MGLDNGGSKSCYVEKSWWGEQICKVWGEAQQILFFLPSNCQIYHISDKEKFCSLQEEKGEKTWITLWRHVLISYKVLQSYRLLNKYSKNTIVIILYIKADKDCLPEIRSKEARFSHLTGGLLSPLHTNGRAFFSLFSSPSQNLPWKGPPIIFDRFLRTLELQKEADISHPSVLLICSVPSPLESFSSIVYCT